jgi:hypothetical protein
MSDTRIEALVSAALDRVRDQLQSELNGLIQGLTSHTAEQREFAAQSVRAEAESAAAALVSGAIAAERAASEDRIAAVRADARAEATAEAQASERAADLARAERLLAAVRSLDDAGSLSDALDALASSAALEAGRAVVLLVRGDQVKGWAHSGFDAALPEVRAFVVPLGEAGLLAEVVAFGRPASTAAADGQRGAQPPVPLQFDSADRVGFAAPVIVDGRVVAVVYADDAGDDVRAVPSAWPEHVELLARHASRCLEGLTARQAVRARAEGAGAPRNGDHDPESARRYARLLVSEIKLYHEATVDEGRRAGDLRARLRAEISKARDLYEARVPAGLRTHGDYFEQELVRTLADGNAALLGHAS